MHTHCRCRVLLLQLITLNDAYTLGRTPLDERLVPRRSLYLYNAQHSKDRNVHAADGIRTRNPSKRASAVLCLRRPGHRDRRQRDVHILNIKICSRNIWYGQGHWPYCAREKCQIRRRRHNRSLILFVLSLSIARSCLLGCLSWVSSLYVTDCLLVPTTLRFVFALPRCLKRQFDSDEENNITITVF